MLPNGRTITRLHPVAFASKRTSLAEERYKPFILEFAALKFSLNKFADIIWGFPVELETDSVKEYLGRRPIGAHVSETLDVFDGLRQCFAHEPLLREVVEALAELDAGTEGDPELRRARHRASQYVVDDGKL
ncbi:hypothetical protein CERSUDRAFT_95533 [Gelatoporia subvermispora B]|uniref:Reverse transcriptase RNase H-like domain-containing protein n=1 Tax=Ceriporiopsis subvermispora (strain B) TaxID=914234 RepID=M2PJ16_CERS8|nr:hypothetical protein CERSUDRAFT_95533 [Gelatoporia subvermispora B]